MLLIMKVLHVSYTAVGGAGKAATALVEAQKEAGIQASHFYVSSNSVTSRPLEKPFVTLAALVDQLVMAKRGQGLMTIARSNFGQLDHAAVEEADVINLHWTPGVASLGQIRSLLDSGKKIVWTMHDMYPLTGGCHYSGTCSGYITDCRNCPKVNRFAAGLVEKQLREKRALSGQGIHYVAPSAGLLSMFRASAIGRDAASSRIPNPFTPQCALGSSENLGRNSDSKRNFAFIAANVNDPRKGLRETLDWWRKYRPEGSTLMLAGAGSKSFTNFEQGVVGLGYLDSAEVSQLLAKTRILVLSSSEDNAPNVVTEAHALGVPVLVPDGLAIRQWLDADNVAVINLSELSGVLSQGCDQAMKDRMAKFVSDRNPLNVARDYSNVYENLMRGKRQHA